MENALSDKSPMKQTILIVDDTSMNRSILSDMLGDEYNIIEASDGTEAVAIMQERFTEISLVLLDIVMPKMDGLEVLAIMNRRGWIRTLPVVMVSSETDAGVIEHAYSLGVTDFISRPFETSIVRRRVLNTIMLYANQKALMEMVEEEVNERERSVAMMVAILSQIVEFRNGESGLHVLHVNTITELLLRQVLRKTDRYELSEADINSITMASSLHDIGKIAVPEEILNKPGRLTDEEFAIMRTHSAAGAEMLSKLPNYESEPMVRQAYEICLWHHERYDGRGYPDGISGEDIPISAQVVALADVYDALTSKRVYKDAYSHEEAIRMIVDGECGAFSPFLIECLLEVAEDIREQLSSSSIAAYGARQARKTLDTATRSDTIFPSERTLELLEYERKKFDFFAKMSNEVQFEYTDDPPVVTIADWSTEKLGLDEVIQDPYNDPKVIEIFGQENLDMFREALRATTPAEPEVQLEVKAQLEGGPRWFSVAARALWDETKEGLRFRGSIGKLVDIHDTRQRLTDLEHKATCDALTGLSNHDYARSIIQERMEAHPDSKFIMIVLDMDNFKEVNDTRGHLFGDETLEHLAEKLRDSVREDDIVARVGGDEFLVCMECAVDPKPLVERIYQSITGEFQGFPVSVSMGVIYVDGSAATYDELFRCADALLYETKRSGRGGYQFGSLDKTDVDETFSALSAIDYGSEQDNGAEA